MGRVLDQRGVQGRAAYRPEERGVAVEVAGRGLPVGDAQFGMRALAAEGHVHGTGRQRTVVEGAAVGVADGFGELADEVEADLGGESAAVSVQVLVQAQVGVPVAEEDRRTALMLAQFDGVDDAPVGDALQYLVLAAGGALRGLSVRVGRALADQVDTDTTLLLGETVVPPGETVLPRRSRVEGVRLHLPGVAEAQMAGGLPDADGLEQLGKLVPGQLLRDPRSGRSGGRPRKSCQIRARPLAPSSRPYTRMRWTSSRWLTRSGAERKTAGSMRGTIRSPR